MPRVWFDRSRGRTWLFCLALVAGCKVAGVSGGDPSDAEPGRGTGGAYGSGGGVPVVGGTGGGSGCARCSDDLHDVIDCNGGLVMRCPGDQGCAAGACVPACDAARAGKSAQGCEFYSVPLGVASDSFGKSCFAALITNTWTVPVTVRAQYNGTPLNIAEMARTAKVSGRDLSYEPLVGGQLAPGQLGILFLAGPVDNQRNDIIDCPPGVRPGITIDPTIPTTGFIKAFQITTTAPVAAFDIYPYGGARSALSSATLLIPTSAWGTNYVAADGYPQETEFDVPGPFVQIVAAEDETMVTINPTKALVGGAGVTPIPAGQAGSYTLSKGQVLQLLQKEELAGSPIASNKPIGVWGGSDCMFIPKDLLGCDAAHQQLLPVALLGSEYVAVRYRDRKVKRETVPWTLVGAVDDTVLTYDPAPPRGAPTSLRSKQVVRFEASDPFTVRSADSRHPFYMAGHMTAGRSDLGGMPPATGLDSDTGDPEFVNAVPPEQWLRSYVFLTDPTYAHTHLVFVRQKPANGTSADVTLDCAGTLSGWTPIGNSKRFEFTRFDFDKKDAGCFDGAHTARSDAPFGLTIWGWDSFVSYAYPAGLSTRPINTVVVIP